MATPSFVRISRFEKPSTVTVSASSAATKEAAVDAKTKTKAHSGVVKTVLNKLSVVADNLETYQGRDTLVTLLHYLALIVADACAFFRLGRRPRKTSVRFVNMFVQLSNCRVMLRLFDSFGAIRDYYRFITDDQIKVSVAKLCRRQ